MPELDLVEWLLDGPLWIMLLLALLVGFYLALFVRLHRSSAINHFPGLDKGPGHANRHSGV